MFRSKIVNPEMSVKTKKLKQIQHRAAAVEGVIPLGPDPV